VIETEDRVERALRGERPHLSRNDIGGMDQWMTRMRPVGPL
jgi:hypothetical protein